MYEPDVDALPPEFRAVLTDADVAALRTGPEYFATLAGPGSPDWLVKTLDGCVAGGYELQFYSSGDAPYRPYFRFYSPGRPAVSLPRPGPLRPDMPPFLGRLYGVIGAFRENDFDTAGGLHPGDRLKPASETSIWVEPGGSIDPAGAVPFLESPSGGQLCYLPDGGGAWLAACRFRRVESLEREVARYFETLLDDTRI